MNSLCALVVVDLILLQRRSEATLVRRPLNAAVVQGSAVTFECSSDVVSDTVYMRWYNNLCMTTASSFLTCTQNLIYYSVLINNFPPGSYNVTETDSPTQVTRNLNIYSTQLSDARAYLCLEQISGVSIGDLKSDSAQLIVIAGDPQCWTNLSASGAVQEFDVITMTCSITYSGNWAPVMRWFNSATRHNLTAENTSTTTTDTTTITSQLTVVASGSLQGSQIVCDTYFSQKPPSLQSTANNVPSYTYRWTSMTLDVHFPPRNVQITPRQSTYHPGDRIQCSADGKPTPSYQWTDLLSGTVIQGPVLNITEDMLNGSFAFQCTANKQHGNISDALNFTVKGPTTITKNLECGGGHCDCEAYKSATIALAVIAVVLTAIIVVMIICLLRRTPPKDTPEERSQPTETGSGTDYSTLNMTSLNNPVVYDSLQRT